LFAEEAVRFTDTVFARQPIHYGSRFYSPVKKVSWSYNLETASPRKVAKVKLQCPSRGVTQKIRQTAFLIYQRERTEKSNGGDEAQVLPTNLRKGKEQREGVVWELFQYVLHEWERTMCSA